MKKYFIFLLVLLMLPVMVLADNSYESKSLEEALKDEGIEYDLGDYKESEEKPTIYLFRGKGCSHCYEFLEYVSKDLVKEYGNYFTLKTYEVWNNKDNANLMQLVSSHFKDDASGVPYIVIGDKTFNGYSSSMNDQIKEAIKKLYDSEEKYDVLSKIDLNKEVTSTKKGTQDNSLTIVTIIFAAVIIVVLLVKSIKK